MDKSQREQLEQRLLQERERAVKAVRQLDDSARSALIDDGELSTWPLHLADEGTDAMEAEKGLLLLSQEGRRLHEIDEALRRLYRTPESFGTCESCGNEIGFERLDLVPWARFCVDCQAAIEEGANAEPRIEAAEPDLPAES